MLSHPTKHMQERWDTPKQTGKQKAEPNDKNKQTKKSNADKMMLKWALQRAMQAGGEWEGGEELNREMDEGAFLMFAWINAHLVA